MKDASGNIYIVGATPVSGHGYDFSTIKLNSSMVLQWQANYNGAANLNDIGSGIGVDASGNVYVTGYTTSATTGKDMITIKYNSSEHNNGLLLIMMHRMEMMNRMLWCWMHQVMYILQVTIKQRLTTWIIIPLNIIVAERNNGASVPMAMPIWKIKQLILHWMAAGTSLYLVKVKKQTEVYEYKTIRYIEANVITPTDYNGEIACLGYSYFQNKGQLRNTSSADISSTIKFYTNHTAPVNILGIILQVIYFPK